MKRRVPCRWMIVALVAALPPVGQGWVPMALAQPAHAAGEQPAEATLDLPVTRAVLYSSGVGYFEHEGRISGSGVMRLMFKTDQINDVLKSMVLIDEGGGTITSVTYGANEPVDRALRSFGVDISGNPSVPDLLTQLRGARVSVSTPEKITGSILNVEERTKVVGSPEAVVTEHVLHIVTEQGIQSVNLSTVGSVELADPKLRNELSQALSMLVTSRDTDRKPVDVKFVAPAGEAGKKPRQVRVGYLVESPVWKSSYRLDLSEKKPLLQGWSIVENTSENDWKNVELSLVSGQPISFVMDLYTPLYASRPVVKLPRFASLLPRMYDEGTTGEDKAVALAEGNAFGVQAGPPSARRMDRARMEKAGMAPPTPAASEAMMMDAISSRPAGLGGGSGVAPDAQASAVGELFRYTLASAVDMPRRRSAMLPIVNKPVNAEKISIYNPSVHAAHPLNGVYLINDTGYKLLAGPVTVFDGGAYAGDAQIDHMAPDEKRLLSYAVDLDVTVDPSISSTSKITAVRVNRGVLMITNMATHTQTYRIKNKAEAPRTVIVEHPYHGAHRKLVSPATFEEKTPSVYRFRVPIDGEKTGDFVVREEQPGTQHIALLNDPLGTFQWVRQNGEIGKEIKDALARAATLKQALSDAERELAELQKESSEIKQGQARLRDNLKTVGSDSTLGKRYLSELSEQEDRIAKLDKELIPAKKKEVEAKRAELESYVNSLNIGG